MLYCVIVFLVSVGLKSCIQVDVIVSSAGGVEEDFIKCLAATYIGDFRLAGKELRLKGINRIGNLLVPNDNYVKFEEWIMPIFDQMLEEQKAQVCTVESCCLLCAGINIKGEV